MAERTYAAEDGAQKRDAVKKREQSGATTPVMAGGTIALFRKMQQTAGNQAVGRLLHQYAAQQAVQRAAMAGPLQLKREAEDEELQTKGEGESVRRTTLNGPRPEPEPFMTRPETRDLIVAITGFSDEFDKSDMIQLVGKGFLNHSLGGPADRRPMETDQAFRGIGRVYRPPLALVVGPIFYV